MAGPQGSNGVGEQDAGPPLADNPPGFVKPGEGINDLAGEDHAFKLAAMRMEQLEQRKAAVSSGGFKLDAEAMRELQPEWEAVAQELQELRDMSQRLGNTPAPANDGASTHQITSVRQHAKICAVIHKQMYDYAYEYAKRIGDAINAYTDSDGSAQDAVNNVRRDV